MRPIVGFIQSPKGTMKAKATGARLVRIFWQFVVPLAGIGRASRTRHDPPLRQEGHRLRLPRPVVRRRREKVVSTI
ncbi:MAG: hypothetical protein ACLU3I_22400 [Acutalibacteraceae bacterium]